MPAVGAFAVKLIDCFAEGVLFLALARDGEIAPIAFHTIVVGHLVKVLAVGVLGLGDLAEPNGEFIARVAAGAVAILLVECFAEGIDLPAFALVVGEVAREALNTVAALVLLAVHIQHTAHLALPIFHRIARVAPRALAVTHAVLLAEWIHWAAFA